MSRMTQRGSGCDELFEDLQYELSDRLMIYDVISYDEKYIIPYWKVERANFWFQNFGGRPPWGTR